MLRQQDNELLCRVGPGTPMGDLLRRYWHPVLLSEELPQPDCPPVRVKVMHEELVAFRDTNGNVGLIDNYCPHRRASLFFGRNEECGLRCVYHGWKFDLEGNCVDMPSEPAESNFKDKVKITAYPVKEAGGMVWAYMGPQDAMPRFTDFGFTHVDPEYIVTTKTPVYCNYIQSIEGNIDTSHISYLHRNLADFKADADPQDGTDVLGYPSGKMSTFLRSIDRTPKVETQPTSYGFREGGIRQTPNGHRFIRINCHVFPVTTFVAFLPWQNRGALIIVPSDDDSCMRYSVFQNPETPITEENRQAMIANNERRDENGLRLMNATNDYLIDREAQRTTSYTGIGGVGEQDYAVTESMGTIGDRTQEHLGTGDDSIIHFRKILLRAARDLQEGKPPPFQDDSVAFDRIRSEEIIIAADEDWKDSGTFAGEGEVVHS